MHRFLPKPCVMQRFSNYYLKLKPWVQVVALTPIIIWASPPAIAQTVQTIDRIVAIVNDTVITEQQVNHEIMLIKQEQQVIAQDQKALMPTADKLQYTVLNSMIEKILQLQLAKNQAIHISEHMVDSAIQQMLQNKAVSLAELEAFLKAHHMDWSTYRKQIQESLTIQQLHTNFIASQIHIDRQEIQRAIEELVAPSVTSYYIENLFIPLSPDASSEVINLARKQINVALKQAQQGASFKTLVAQQSATTHASNWIFNDLGWVRLQTLPDIFISALKTLKPKQIAGPFRTDKGFHLIHLVEKRAEHDKTSTKEDTPIYHIRHILIKNSPSTNDEAAQQRLLNIREHCLIQGNFTEQAQEHSEDLASATKGGDLDWILPDTVHPQLEAQVKALNIGEISQPFKTPSGWHIVQLLNRTTLTSDNPQWQKQQAMEHIWQRKFQILLKQLLRELRAQAYVVIKD